ncbi:MAG: CCA tRNA nucleotidyltransferase [Pseudorhodoplanes sp.]
MTLPPRIEADWLAEGPVALLLNLLNDGNDEARVVGGAVRNALLGETISDIDIATTLLPADVVSRVETAGLKAVPTGIEHGTITVVIDGRPFEVTTLREDVETFGRHASVRFGRDWVKDAQRRDFTMNALSLSADGTVQDPVGGYPDLIARRVRFIGDPSQRIAEDYLRILRFFRFHAYYGGDAPDAEGLNACIRARSGLDGLSRERVRMELFKLVIAPRALPSLSVMEETGLLLRLLGGVPLFASFAKMVKVESAIGLPPDPVRRLGALTLFVAEDAARVWRALRLANVEYERLIAMAADWWRVDPDITPQEVHALLYRLKAEQFVDRVLLAWSRSQASTEDEAWQTLASLPRRWRVPVFPLRAADFVKRGVGKGPPLGAALRAAEMSWIAADFPIDLDRLGTIADEAAAIIMAGSDDADGAE